MRWNTVAEFFAMGGHGLYVWGAYAVAAVLFVAEPWLVARRHWLARRDDAAAQMTEGEGG